MQMQELFLNAALQGDVKVLGRLIKEREDVLHWRNENGETVADEYRRLLGPSADRRISMLLAPPFEPLGFEPCGFVMPAWFFVPGGWDSIGIKW
jgi:hypothetical protein